MAKTAKELIEMREETLLTMEKLQMRIAYIDASLMHDPKYRDELESLDPRWLAQHLQPVTVLERNGNAPLN
jgi:hypothetical protein